MMRGKEGRKRRIKFSQGKQMIAVMFGGIVAFICLVNLITRDKSFSEKENRMLEQKPELTAAGIESGNTRIWRFMDQYESYKSDQFAGRNLWVSLKTNVDLLLGKRESNGVFKGKEGYLLEDIAVPNQEQLDENLKAMKEFSSDYSNVPFYML